MDAIDESRVLRDLKQAAAAAAAKSELFDALGCKLAELSVTEQDGPVSVTVASSGALLDLRLSDGAARLRPAEIAGMVTACVRRAQARVPHLVSDAVRDIVGPGDPMGARIVGYHERLAAGSTVTSTAAAPMDASADVPAGGDEMPDSFMVGPRSARR